MIALLSAMHEEMQSILAVLHVSKKLEIGKRTYYQGRLFDQDIVLVFSRWGKVAAAATVTQLINSFSPSEIIFSGVAGAITHQLNIGDVVLGTHLVQHDMDASPLYKKMEIPLLDKTTFASTDSKQLSKATQQFISQYNHFFSQEVQEKYKIKTPKYIKGLILSGDQFVNSKSKIKALKSQAPDALCVEMEGAAVAQVCYEYGIPFQIIRVISDKADDNSHIDFPKFAKEIAGKYALEILRNYL